MPNQLPFLPGNSYADPTINRYHKTQLLGIKDGTITEKTVNLQENVNPDLIATMTQGVPSQLSGVRGRGSQAQEAIPAIAPKWLKYDR